MQLTDIKGVGEKTALNFNKLNIYTPKDLINYFPRDYDLFKKPVNIKDIECFGIHAIKAMVVANATIKKVRNLTITNVLVKDEDGNKLKLTWFNMPYLSKMLKIGYKYIFRGRVTSKSFSLVDGMEQPEIYTLEKYEEKMGCMQPVYKLKKGITSNAINKAVKEYLNNLSRKEDILEEYLPDSVIEKNQLISYREAIEKIHFPQNEADLLSAKKRIVFDEFFMFIYALRSLKNDEVVKISDIVINDNSLSEHIIDNLQYKLTDAQTKVLKEIRKDVSSGKLMNRLIQGDVGCGKTIIAFLSMFDFVKNGYQTALMAPTEVLAKQHYESLMEIKDKYNLNINPVLLVGSTKKKDKVAIYDKIKDGSVDIVIGTHAIIEDVVEYNNLGLVITDEQHRFGVRQREKLSNKGNAPHILVMSATPIPRTLGIIMYGDLDISIIDELPANRLPIKNCVINRDERSKAIRFIEKQVSEGRQAYVICPMVWENENIDSSDVVSYTNMLRQILPSTISIEFLHGKMKAEEKNAIMDAFAKNKINVLVSTTVVEVGVNVPNATLMIIEDADRFGLASLHQLRGRVGRGMYQSYCVFISANKSKNATERLNIINKSNDGFYIASEDLKLRGSGDFFGVRQSGDIEFKMADIFNDADILKLTSEVVNDIETKKYVISDEEYAILLAKINEFFTLHMKLNL